MTMKILSLSSLLLTVAIVAMAVASMIGSVVSTQPNATVQHELVATGGGGGGIVGTGGGGGSTGIA